MHSSTDSPRNFRLSTHSPSTSHLKYTVNPSDCPLSPRSASNFSDFGISFSTEQIIPNSRVSVYSEETTELTSAKFHFEKKVQTTLKMMKHYARFCDHCKTNAYFVERFEVSRLGVIDHLKHIIGSLRCCREPKGFAKFHVKKMYCLFCGNSDSMLS